MKLVASVIVIIACMSLSHAPFLTACGGFFNTSGVIVTPHFPYTYPSNLKCVWRLQVQSGSKIVLQFTDFEIDWRGDYLLIFSEGSLVANLSGSHLPFNETLGRNVTLVFVSDESVGNAGFKAHWTTEPADDGQLTRKESHEEIPSNETDPADDGHQTLKDSQEPEPAKGTVNTSLSLGGPIMGGIAIAMIIGVAIFLRMKRR